MMRRRNSLPNDADHRLWRQICATVRPLPDRQRITPGTGPEAAATTSTLPARPPPPPAKPAVMPRRPAMLPATTAGSIRSAPLAPHAGLDRRLAERLAKGRIPLEGRLDLHGMNQDDARHALTGFLLAARTAGKRCVLVVTGKGKGILRESLPRWLTGGDVAAAVLATAPAQPRHGGGGAFYVLLRRHKHQHKHQYPRARA